MKKTSLLFFIILFLLTSATPVFAEESLPGQIRTGDILCFGSPDDACGFDGKWLVLDAEHTNTGENGIFIVSLNLIAGEQGEALLFRDIGDVSVSFSDRGEAFAADHPGSQDYQGSDIQRWCKRFLTSHFSEEEQQAVLSTKKSDTGIAIPGFGIPLPGAQGGTVDFDPAENILDGDRMFLLSAEEATNESYGFTDNRSRVALCKGTAAGYWLRSPHIPTFPLDVGFVFYFGAVMDYAVNGKAMFAVDTYARPACNLDRTAITSLEKLADYGEKSVWRVSFSGKTNEREYDTGLPAVGKVPDVMRIMNIALVTIPVLLVAIIILIVFLGIKLVKRRKNLKEEK